MIAHMFQVAIVFLGISAAIFGAWLERVGPRRAMFTAAVCFARRISGRRPRRCAAPFWLIVLGLRRARRHRSRARLHLAGVDADQVVSRPARDGHRARHHGVRRRRDDRVSALDALMAHFKTATSMGVAETFVRWALIYFVFMMFGMFTVRCRPPAGRPRGSSPRSRCESMITTAQRRCRARQPRRHNSGSCGPCSAST